MYAVFAAVHRSHRHGAVAELYRARVPWDATGPATDPRGTAPIVRSRDDNGRGPAGNELGVGTAVRARSRARRTAVRAWATAWPRRSKS